MSFNAEALRRREKRRVLCHGRARGGMGWETREACPHEWGHGSLKGYATVLRRRANELRMDGRSGFAYLAKVNLNPVEINRSLRWRPWTGLLRKRSLAVTCQPSHFFRTVLLPMSKLSR